MHVRTLQLVLVTGAVALVAAPGAFGVGGLNLVQNGSAELGTVAPDDSSIVAPTGWTTSGNFTAALYGASGLPGADATVAGGKALFAGGPSNASSTATQTVAVPSSWVKVVRAGRAKATISAALGGWEGQGDAATVTYLFLDASGSSIGSARIGPISAAQRGSVTKLLPVSKVISVPAGTRSVKVTIAAIRGSGSYNDGYADNVSLRLST